ncbi:MAG: hypothetical protein KDD84_24660, partial [Caldilineaceae bacterium]|nr:hypothetical protein [Caldilineaceae bacterium]
ARHSGHSAATHPAATHYGERSMTRIILTAVGIGLMEKDWLWDDPRKAAGKAGMTDAQKNELPRRWERLESYRGSRKDLLPADDALATKGWQDYDGTPLHKEARAMARVLAQFWANRLSGKDAQQRLKDSPPELASLSLLEDPLGEHDEVRLLYTETCGSAACAAVLAEALRLIYPTVKVPVPTCLHGVQMDDIDRLAKDGFRSWALAVQQAQNDAAYSDDRVLVNITGGYKGMAPLATLIAFGADTPHKRIKVFYLYEEANKLLYLPGSPLVQIQLDAITEYAPLWNGKEMLNPVLCGAQNQRSKDLITKGRRAGILEERNDGICALTITGKVLFALWEARQQAPDGQAAPGRI